MAFLDYQQFHAENKFNHFKNDWFTSNKSRQIEILTREAQSEVMENYVLEHREKVETSSSHLAFWNCQCSKEEKNQPMNFQKEKFCTTTKLLIETLMKDI